MFEVRVIPDRIIVPAASGQALLGALQAGGVPITHACGGRARCSTCRVRVVDGLAHCLPRNEAESAIAEKLSLQPDMRLACQLEVCGPIEVRRLVLDAEDEALVGSGLTAGAAVGRDDELVILFSDVADFTPFSEALPAYDVVHTLDRWFAAAGRVVAAHDGRIDNYMGDGFLAVFTRADAAVRAGLGLLAAASALDAYTREVFGLPFRSRVGIHQGQAVVGTLGAAHNRRSTVIGDVVNLAARIEAANKPLDTALLVSAEVDAAIGPAFRRGRTGHIPLKGKTGTYRLIEIVAEGDGEGAGDAQPGEAPAAGA